MGIGSGSEESSLGSDSEELYGKGDDEGVPIFDWRLFGFEGRWNFMGVYPPDCGEIEPCDIHY